jgi:hypothetical protein
MTDNTKKIRQQDNEENDSNKNETLNKPGAGVVDYGRSEQKEVQKTKYRDDREPGAGDDENAR